MKRIALYARYSSDLQRDASIEDQLRENRRYVARQEGWKVVRDYADHAISGSTWQRPELQRLLRDGRAGAFDIIVAESLDRLSRDQEDIARIYKLITFADLQIVTLSEGLVNEMHVGLKGTMNAMFLKDLASKVRRGQAGRAGKGRVASGRAYGYKVVPAATDEDRGQREIVPVEAEVIRRIFRQYAAGMSPGKIAQQLNRDGVHGPRAKAWNPSSIIGTWQRGTGILNNELYAGRLVWGKLTFRKNPETDKRVCRRTPDAVERAEVPELRIIDEALWQAVKARQLRTRTSGEDARPTPRTVYLLSGLTYCGACGGAYAVQYRSRLCCRSRVLKHTCDNKRTISREEIEARVLKAMQKFVAIDAFEEFCEVYVARVNAARREQRRRKIDIPKEIKACGDKQMELFGWISKGVGEERLIEEIRQLDVQIAELKAQLAAGVDDPTTIPPVLHPRMAKDFQKRTRGLIAALDNGSEEQRTLAAETLRGFLDKIIVPPSGPLQVVGNLGALLAAATGWDGKMLCDSALDSRASGVRFARHQARLHIIAA